jgi:curved DNA-binding protein CbpA
MKVVIGIRQEIYNLFGIPRFSDLPACKKAFHREILKYHPDKNVNLNEEEREKQAARTRILILAIEIMKDVTSKAKYDNELRASILAVFRHTAKKSSSSSSNSSSGSAPTPTPANAASSTANTGAGSPEASSDKSAKAEERSEYTGE